MRETKKDKCSASDFEGWKSQEFKENQVLLDNTFFTQEDRFHSTSWPHTCEHPFSFTFLLPRSGHMNLDFILYVSDNYSKRKYYHNKESILVECVNEDLLHVDKYVSETENIYSIISYEDPNEIEEVDSESKRMT